MGELATPRWATREGAGVPWRSSPPVDPGDNSDQATDIREDGSDPSSPWTIEAIDGDGDEVEVRVLFS